MCFGSFHASFVSSFSFCMGQQRRQNLWQNVENQRKAKLDQHKKHAANQALGYFKTALKAQATPSSILAVKICFKNSLDLLSNYCSHRPLAPLLARQGHQAAEQHSLPGQGKVSAPPHQLQREGRTEARRWWPVQLSRSHSTMPEFCLSGQWDGSLKRSGLSYREGAPREQGQMTYEPGSESLDCPASLVQSKWEEEEPFEHPTPKNRN